MEDFASELEVLLEHSSSDTNNNASSVSSSRSPGESGEEHCTAFLPPAAPSFNPEIPPAASFPPPAHSDRPESSAASTVRGHGPHGRVPTGPDSVLLDRAPRAFPLRYHPSYLNPTGDPVLDPNWEAIESYLAGHVRPGPDVARVYKCSTCGLEFPNAQAFGGHMSSHSKGRRAGDKPLAEGRRERAFKKAGKKAKRQKLSTPAPAQVAAADERENGDGVSGAAEGLNYVEFIDTCL